VFFLFSAAPHFHTNFFFIGTPSADEAAWKAASTAFTQLPPPAYGDDLSQETWHLKAILGQLGQSTFKSKAVESKQVTL